MIEIDSIKNLSFDLSPENIKKAEKVYYIKDFLNIEDNPLALAKDEITAKLDEFASSNIAKANTKVQGYISNVKGAITSLDIAEKTTEAYRVVKPIVKKAVNVGGIWLNFANVAEMAQDVLQLIFREAIGKGKNLLENYLNTLLNTPVLLSLLDSDDDKLILDIIRELEEEIKQRIAEYLLNLSLDDYLKLVRLTNKNITKKEIKSEYSYQYRSIGDNEVRSVFGDESYLYLIKENLIEKIDNADDSISTFLEKENILDFYILNGNTYLAYLENYEIKIEKNGSVIGTTSGEFLKFDEFENQIIVVTSEEITYGDNISLFTTGDIKGFIASEKIYFVDENDIYSVDNLTSIPVKIFTLTSGDINSIEFYEYLYFTYYKSNKAFINRLVFEREFEEKEFPESAFSFYKNISNGKIYAYKNNSLIEIKLDNEELITETLTSRLPGDISDIDVVSINGDNYFITAVGPSIFVAKEGFLNNWEEKYIDFENLGIKEGMISSIKVDNNEVYLSSLKSLLKVSDNSSLITVPPNPLPDPLDWINKEAMTDHPEIRTEEVFIGEVLIDKPSIISFDKIIYKIYDKNTISCGNKIYHSGNEVYSSISNIYNFIKKNNKYYYFNGQEVYENELLLKNLEVKGNILGFVEIGGNVYVFTEEYYYKETGNDSFIKEMITPFPLSKECHLLADNKSLLIYDENKVFNYNKKNKEIIDLFQVVKNDTIKKIQNTKTCSILFGESEVKGLFLNESMGVDKEYNNGYKASSHFESGKGIAPFDTRTLIVREYPSRKNSYVESLSPEFKEHFAWLMKEIPTAVLMVIIEEILDDVLRKENFSASGEEGVREFITEYLKTSITAQLYQLMEQNFSLSPEDSESFVEKLLDRLGERGVEDITKEFYFIAMEFVKNALEKTVYDLLALDIINSMWVYYENHKYEWGEQITSEIDKTYLEAEEYVEVLDSSLDTELKNSFNILMNTEIKNEVDSYASGKTGELSEEDKNELKSIATTKAIPSIELLASYEAWVDSISVSAGTFYKPKILQTYEDIIDNSSMDPIQWQELPATVNRETFTKVLNILLDRVKEEMKKGLYFLILEDGVPCFSCVNAEEVYKGIKSDFKSTLNMSKSYSAKKLYDTKTFEELPTSYFVPSNLSTKASLKKVLDNQTDLYKSYLIPFIDLIIDSSREEYEEEVPV